MSLENLETIDIDDIYSRAAKLKDEGYRFAALTCEKVNQEYELIYHFDLNYNLKNIKAKFMGDKPIKSISNIYKAAFLIENEIQDLYGFTFNDLIIDYKGNLYMVPDGPKNPLA